MARLRVKRFAIVFTAILGVAGSVAAAQEGYRWHMEQPDSLQFGVPETDDRSMRIDCVTPTQYEVRVPAWGSMAGAAVPITVSSGATTETRTGKIDASGDGADLVLALPADSLLPRSLHDGKPVRLANKEGGISVPGASASLLATLTATCRAPAAPG
jgi:hypothetical protein